MKAQPTAPVPRFALTRQEAAAAVGVSIEFFRVHIQPEVRVIRRGAARLIPVSELERWVAENAETTIPERTAA